MITTKIMATDSKIWLEELRLKSKLTFRIIANAKLKKTIVMPEKPIIPKPGIAKISTQIKTTPIKKINISQFSFKPFTYAGAK